MRVLQLGPYPPPHGGVQTNLVAIRNYLLQHKSTAPVINLTRNRQDDGDDVYYPENARELLQLLIRLQFDVVHLHIGGNLSNRLLGLGLVCANIPGAKAVLTFHSGGYPSSPEGKHLGPRSLAGFVFRQFDYVIAVNPEIEKFFAQCGVRPSKIRLILPHATAAPPEDTPLPIAIQQFFDDHRQVLLTVGLLETEYDLELQIDVLEQFPGVGLLIIGSGSLEAQLRDMIASKPYGRNILLAGDVPHAATLRAIQRCNMLLRTTHYDGDSISVREALHLGTPVIASNNGMRPGGCDLVPACDEEALEKAIAKRLSGQKPRRPQIAGGDENVKAVVDLYSRLLKQDR
ncbi:MAG: glycosyltransferase [Bryobacteraceae bacterium]